MSDSDISKSTYSRGQNPASRSNLAQFRTIQLETQGETNAEKAPNLPIVEFSNPLLANQRLAQSMATAAAPEMVRVLVNTAQGKGKGVPHSVRVQAAGKVLEAAGVCGAGAQSSARAAVGDFIEMDSACLAAFVEAGHRALELRRQAATAEDAVIVPR